MSRALAHSGTAAARVPAVRAAAEDDVLADAFLAGPFRLAVVERATDGRHRVLRASRALEALDARKSLTSPTGALEDLLVHGSVPAADGLWHRRQCWGTGLLPVVLRWQVQPLPVQPGHPPRLMVQIDGDAATAQSATRAETQRQARRRARLLELLPEPVIVRGLDGTILYWNAGAEQIYGIARHDAIGRRTHDLLATTFVGCTLGDVEERLDTDGSWQGRLVHRHADGRLLTMASLHVRDDDPDGESVVLEINVDITAQLDAEVALARSEAIFRSQFAHTGVGHIIRRIDGTIDEVNNAMCAMLLREPHELIGRTTLEMLDPRVDGVPVNALQTMLEEGVDQARFDGTLARADGSILPVDISVSLVRDPDGTPLRVIGSFQDISERKATVSTLTRQAMHDALTELPNRALLTARMAAAVDGSAAGATVGIAYLDLDGFKAVNDRFGHEIGDQLLIEVSRRLRGCVRGGDTVARLGGDEFVLLCPNLDRRDRLSEIAARASHVLASPYELFGHSIDFVSASIGLSFLDNGKDAAGALAEADRAMYAVKAQGRNGISDTPAPAQ